MKTIKGVVTISCILILGGVMAVLSLWILTDAIVFVLFYVPSPSAELIIADVLGIIALLLIRSWRKT